MAAILAADVVGYTRLMELDETGTLAALKGRRRTVAEPLIAENQGRIFKVNGDGVLVEFASAVNAVQCAIDIQQGMAAANEGVPAERQIILRIGVNLGDVMIEGGDVYGEGVNIASRLETLAEPGDILVSAATHEFVRNKIGASFEDLGLKNLKNISEPVHAFRVCEVPEVVAQRVPVPPADKPAVAVLPFANKSDDPGQDYFAEGITDDITRELYRFRSLLVIDPQSVAGYRKRTVSPQTAGRELGVHYLVEGSVRRAENRIRINVRLIEAETGKHLWDERYDRNMADIFEIQDEVAQSVVSNVAGRLDEASTERAVRLNSRAPSIYDLLLQGKHFMQSATRADTLHARELFDRALKIEPKNARVHVALARSYRTEAISGWSGDAKAAARKAYDFAQKAVGFDDTDSEAHLLLAWGHLRCNGSFDLASNQVESAIRINPNDCHNYCFKSWLLICVGDQESSIAAAKEALRRNPLQQNDCLYTIGCADFFCGRYEHALLSFSQISPSDYVEVNGCMAACYAELGRHREARQQAEEFKRLIQAMDMVPPPLEKAESWRAFWTRYGAFKDQAQLDMLLTSLEKAGLSAPAASASLKDEALSQTLVPHADLEF
jgi:TolB-like protein/class 3 adenylate cyclase/Tfp pilus assembly protein PilF